MAQNNSICTLILTFWAIFFIVVCAVRFSDGGGIGLSIIGGFIFILFIYLCVKHNKANRNMRNRMTANTLPSYQQQVHVSPSAQGGSGRGQQVVDGADVVDAPPPAYTANGKDQQPNIFNIKVDASNTVTVPPRAVRPGERWLGTMSC